MDVELEPRTKALAYKIKATSRESPAQKAANVFDPDLRTHWSTGTNTKEWILLELDEPCLLSHIRIYNKSVLEWEISVGLRFKPEAFLKVRPRCEAPRREMVYPMNYTPCRYVRISCLRGNPIAIFFIQLMGVTVTGLEPELQPIANYLIPHIISHKQDGHDMHLQLLQDVAKNLLVFLPQLETDLTNFPDAAETNIRFFAMLAGPFYPVLRLSNERKASSVLPFSSDLDASKSNPSSTLTVSSNFEAQPRRSRSPPFPELASSSIAFRSDAVIILLRKAYKESHLGIVCRRASIALHRLVEANNFLGESSCTDDLVEEGILHVLFGCASQPHLCCKLADSNSNFWSLLPLIQALLPALRPPISLPDQVDDSFSQWKHPSVQHALSQIITISSSSVYHPLLHACAGYLSSFLSSHAKAACVLIDLCSGPLSPWISTITAKVDLAIELLEDLLGVIQGVPQSAGRARAALKYILLALSGHMDDVLSKYKEFKHRLLFLLEMLEPFLDPVIIGTKNTTSEDASDIHLEEQKNCFIALNVIRTALRRPAILPSVESEWRRGSVAPSVLLSVLGPHMPLPSNIDLCKCSFPKVADQESLAVSSDSVICSHGASSISNSPDEAKGKIDASEAATSKDLESWLWSFRDYLQLVNHQDSVFRASEFERLAADLCSQHDITPESHEAAIDALLLAAECYVNPFFMISYGCNSELMNQMKIIGSKFKNKNGLVEFNKDLKRCNVNLETIAYLESKRDITVLQILLRAAKLDLESERILALGKPYTYYFEGNQQALEISQVDIESADVVTLVRQNQSLLCHFVIRQLRREQQSSHEILLQSLLFLLHSATELSCSVEDVIDIILQSAENLSGQLTSLYTQLKAGNIQLEMEKLHGLRRRWALLERLVIASSGNDEGTNPIGIRSAGFIYRTLVPPSSWMQKISRFSSCTCPLSRFLGWMAVSRYAKQYLKEHLFIASDLSQISSLLSIFADELALTDNLVKKKIGSAYLDPSGTKTHSQVDKEFESSNQSDAKLSFQVLFPHLHMFFPNMRKQFGEFGEIILEAIGMQLKSLPCSAVPDILCWFADLCLWPYLETIRNHLHLTKNANPLRGHIARNAKAVIFYVLESITVEHMEALVNEMPRVAHILISLCRASYCDVAFLNSILSLLGPLISYSLRKVSDDEKHLSDASLHQDFHLSNFEELFDSIRHEKELNEVPEEKKFQGSLMICILGHLFPDLSFRRKKEVLESLLLWVDFTTSVPISSIYDYLSAFQKLINSCLIVVAQGLKSFGVNLPLERKQSTAGGPNLSINDGLNYQFDSSDLVDGYVNRLSKTCESDDTCTDLLGEGLHILSADEFEELLDQLGKLISGLLPAIEASWKMHYKLGMRLTCTLANCLFFSRCLSVVIQASTGGGDGQDTHQFDSTDLRSRYWVNALEGLVGAISSSQKNHCWQVASAMLDFLLKLPENITFSSVMGMSKTGVLNDLEKKLCLSLCKLRNEFDGAKPVLKEVLSSSFVGKPSDPNFQSIRETILQVLSSLTSIQSYFEFFSERIDQQSQELEEAEIEMELLREEAAFEESSGFLLEEAVPSLTISSDKEINRLQQIKEEIRSLERSKLREEIVARRQKKLLMRHARTKCLEEATLREMELLQELDRARTNELERDIERQQELENERARTRELQFNLDMEKERQIQKELQRELEQVESGTRSFRREFSSNPSSRSRERYRDRDSGRSGQEANLRSSSRGHDGGAPQMTTTISTGSSTGPTVVLAGSRSFSGQLPTILQPRDRADERTSNYEDAIEGSRDSGDASSIGDSESGSAFDGLPGTYGTAPRHGSRGSKSRQIVERRERDGRREGQKNGLQVLRIQHQRTVPDILSRVWGKSQ
ncbi:hypothetical protein OPV22_006303 [Ensete ventricosum]|uniref:F5/8 type C domain-containing protein n=1 Tax=Ensete ventricosum TaxID=4639 RepID=A0AAV8QBB3_ENSVE|nr:hypothetical protein OPV22_006303 [Ensete ventricosum]